ncbi:MAG: transcription elongation factor GreA [Minisyncoccia bacterium]
MHKDKEYLTEAKFNEFKAELEELRTKKRKEIAEALEFAKSLGDLSENAEYHDARDMQARVEDRINHLEALLKNASIVESHDTHSVSVGSTITLSRNGDKETKVYTIVGAEESDVSKGKISVRSPLGVAVLDKKKGDTFTFKTPGGTVNYKVIDIK